MGYAYLTDDQKSAFHQWLKSASEDDRHGCAYSWNWDHDTGPLRWIFEQPDCERATAQLLFWRTEPTYYARKYPNRAAAEAGPDYELKVYDFIFDILKRWKGGFYRGETIAYDALEDGFAAAGDVRQFAGHAELSIPESMVLPTGRRPARPSEQFDEGIPFSIRGLAPTR